jgi:hypothetical protein
MIFRKKGFVRAVNEFSSRANVAEVLTFVKGQKVPGELVVSLPGNGGISAITFREKEQIAEVVEQNVVDAE